MPVVLSKGNDRKFNLTNIVEVKASFKSEMGQEIVWNKSNVK